MLDPDRKYIPIPIRFVGPNDEELPFGKYEAVPSAILRELEAIAKLAETAVEAYKRKQQPNLDIKAGGQVNAAIESMQSIIEKGSPELRAIIKGQR